MTEIKLVAFDLDGTTVPMMGNEPTERFCRSLLEASSRGVLCAPFTGRSITTIPEAIMALPIRYLAHSNGAGIYDRETKSSIYHSVIPQETALSAIDFLLSMDLPVQVFSDGAILLARYMVDEPQRYHLLPHHLRSIAEGTALVVENLPTYIREKHPPIDKINITYLVGELREQVVAELGKNPQLCMVSSGGVNLEINDIKANKGCALRFLAERLGIPMSQVMAIGDNDNDVQMLAVAGYGMAVANASPAAKAAASYHLPAQDEDGAAIAVEQYILKRQPATVK